MVLSRKPMGQGLWGISRQPSAKSQHRTRSLAMKPQGNQFHQPPEWAQKWMFSPLEPQMRLGLWLTPGLRPMASQTEDPARLCSHFWPTETARLQRCVVLSCWVCGNLLCNNRKWIQQVTTHYVGFMTHSWVATCKLKNTNSLKWKLQILSESARMWPYDNNKSFKYICYRKLNVRD